MFSFRAIDCGRGFPALMFHQLQRWIIHPWRKTVQFISFFAGFSSFDIWREISGKADETRSAVRLRTDCP